MEGTEGTLLGQHLLEFLGFGFGLRSFGASGCFQKVEFQIGINLGKLFGQQRVGFRVVGLSEVAEGGSFLGQGA